MFKYFLHKPAKENQLFKLKDLKTSRKITLDPKYFLQLPYEVN